MESLDDVYVNKVGRELPEDYGRLLSEKFGYFHTWALVLKVFVWDAFLAARAGPIGWLIKLVAPIVWLYMVAYASLGGYMAFCLVGGFLSAIIFDSTKGFKPLLVAYWGTAVWFLLILSPFFAFLVWFMVSQGNRFLTHRTFKVTPPGQAVPRVGNYGLRN